jgi:hypothetical protein
MNPEPAQPGTASPPARRNAREIARLLDAYREVRLPLKVHQMLAQQALSQEGVAAERERRLNSRLDSADMVHSGIKPSRSGAYMKGKIRTRRVLQRVERSHQAVGPKDGSAQQCPGADWDGHWVELSGRRRESERCSGARAPSGWLRWRGTFNPGAPARRRSNQLGSGRGNLARPRR